jgi:aerobic-type carbon monoxide dehydrogenase small subunit (CoxS/CutS family)/copper chaperone CopZ
MADDAGPADSSNAAERDAAERAQPVVTRRDFIAGAGIGVAATAVVGGGVALVTRSQPAPAPQVVQTAPGGPAVQVAPPAAPAPGQAAPAQQPAIQQQPAPQAAQAASTLPRTMRRVTLNLDGATREVTVDVRESLWTTMSRQLGLSGSNLGCDRAQCGACAVVVDGLAVNGCTVLTARLGRGQKILTVEGIRQGPGIEGLHPIQRAFWQQGGYQCGICTRGFIMSSYALLQTTQNPTNDQIREALAGNICRCGEYPKIYSSVQAAAAEMRAPRQTKPVVLGPAPVRATPLVSKTFTFVTQLGSPEFIADVNLELRKTQGISGVSGNDTTANVTYDDTVINEDAIRKAFAEAGYAVK